MPWLWPDLLFKLMPEGREHDRCLNIVHNFTSKVIEDRARDFHADNVRSKRSAFLGKAAPPSFAHPHPVSLSDLLLKQMHEEQLTLIDIQEEVDTFMFEVRRSCSERLRCLQSIDFRAMTPPLPR